MHITGAVARTQHATLTVEELELDEPRDDEILVRMAAVGVCGGDLAALEQLVPAPLPAVLGHEGSGTVVRVGSRVSAVAPGDAVVLSFNSCGHCAHCAQGHPAYCEQSFPLNWGAQHPDGSTTITDRDGDALGSNFFGQSSFATYALTNERNTVKVPADVPLELLGPLGCGFGTGAGTVLNALKPPPGSTVAVLGAGSVAFAALFAAKIADVRAVVVARRAERLQLAEELGADAVVDTSKQDLTKALESLGGPDFVVDTTGAPQVIEAALSALKPDGTLAILGAGHDPTLSVAIPHLIPGRTIRGVPEGDSNPHKLIPYMIDQYRAGVFPIDRLVSYYRFSHINEAIEHSRSGKTIKPILTF